MGISTSPINPGQNQVKAKPFELSKEILAAIDQQIIGATDRAYKYADSLIKPALKSIEEKLESIDTPREVVLEVKIDTRPKKKLKSEAVPFLDRMLVNAKCGLNTLLIGPAGCGKTFAGEQLAEALDLKFGHLCFTAGASESWLFGRQTPDGFIEAPFSRLYREGGVFLGDEFDAADSNMVLSMNTALANGKLFNPINGETYSRHSDFVFVAAANTSGKGANAVYTGRTRLDGATLDRFIQIEVNYNESMERKLTRNHEMTKLLQLLRKKLAKNDCPEIISTRCILQSLTQLHAGVSAKEILKSITLSWSDDTKQFLADSIEERKIKTGEGRDKHGATVKFDEDYPF